MAPHPRADAEHGPVVPALGGHLHRLTAHPAHAHDDVRLERGLGVVGPAGREPLLQQVVEPDHGRVGEHHVAEHGRWSGEATAHPEALLERPRQQRLQQLGEGGREAVVEAALLDGLPGRAFIAPTERGQRALPADREAEDEHPDQIVDPDTPLPLDGAGLAGQRVHDGLRNHLAQLAADVGRSASGHRYPPSLGSSTAPSEGGNVGPLQLSGVMSRGYPALSERA